MSPTIKQLLADIEAYRKRTGLTRTEFGKQAAGDGFFISRIEQGRCPGLKMLDKVYGYMGYDAWKLIR